MINLTSSAQAENSRRGMVHGLRGATLVLEQKNWTFECSTILTYITAERARREASENLCIWTCWILEESPSHLRIFISANWDKVFWKSDHFEESRSERGSSQSSFSNQRLWSNILACMITRDPSPRWTKIRAMSERMMRLVIRGDGSKFKSNLNMSKVVIQSSPSILALEESNECSGGEFGSRLTDEKSWE